MEGTAKKKICSKPVVVTGICDSSKISSTTPSIILISHLKITLQIFLKWRVKCYINLQEVLATPTSINGSKVFIMYQFNYCPFVLLSHKRKLPSYTKIMQKLFSEVFYTSTPPRWNPPRRGDGAYLTKRFQSVHQQKELVGAMLLRLSRTNGSSSILCQ